MYIIYSANSKVEYFCNSIEKNTTVEKISSRIVFLRLYKNINGVVNNTYDDIRFKHSRFKCHVHIYRMSI